MDEITKEQLKADLYMANKVIQKLEQELGGSRGAVALLEVERDMFLQHIQQQQQEEETKKEPTDVEKPEPKAVKKTKSKE